MINNIDDQNSMFIFELEERIDLLSKELKRLNNKLGVQILHKESAECDLEISPNLSLGNLSGQINDVYCINVLLDCQATDITQNTNAQINLLINDVNVFQENITASTRGVCRFCFSGILPSTSASVKLLITNISLNNPLIINKVTSLVISKNVGYK